MAHHTFFFLLWRHGQDTIIILIVWTDLGFNARKVWDTKLSCGLLIVPPSVEDASIRIVYWCSVLVKGDPPMSSLGEPIRLPKNAKEFHHHHEVSQKVRLTLQAHPLPRRKWIYIFHFFLLQYSSSSSNIHMSQVFLAGVGFRNRATTTI